MNKQTQLTRTLTVTALMIAMRLIIEMIPSIKMGNLVQIGFGFIGAALAGVILGPYRAAVVGFFVDIFVHFLCCNHLEIPFLYTETSLEFLRYYHSTPYDRNKHLYQECIPNYFLHQFLFY